MKNTTKIKIGTLPYDENDMLQISTDSIIALQDFHRAFSNSMLSIVSIDLISRDKHLTKENKLSLIKEALLKAFKFQELYPKYQDIYY